MGKGLRSPNDLLRLKEHTLSEPMDEMNSNDEEKEMMAQLFTIPAAKLMQAQKRADSFAKEKEGHNACRELIQCIALTRILYGNGHWRLAKALANLAHSYLTLQGLPVQAIHHANSAKYIIFTGEGIPPASSEGRGEILSTLLTIFYTVGVANLMQKNGKESYCNLQKAEKVMEELRRLDWRGTPELKISERDLIAALGRASLQENKPDLAAKHFEKATDIIISSEGERAPELINLYLDLAQAEQMKKNHEKSIGYLLQTHSISLSLHTKFSAEVASTALLLGKAYAATGEEKHSEAAEMYLSESLEAYKVALGMDHSKTINALEDFTKWLGRVGKRKQAYDLLKESFESQQDPCSDFNEQAVERLYIMGCICLAEEKIKEAYQLLSKVLKLETRWLSEILQQNPVVQTLHRAGRLDDLQGPFELYEFCKAECVQIQVAIYGPHHRKCKKIQELLVMLKMVPALRDRARET